MGASNPRPPLTDKQRAVYALAIQYYLAVGEPCSTSWLARRLDLNRNTVRDHAAAIRRKGWATPDAPAFVRLQA